MDLQGRDLEQNMSGEDVALLIKELQILDFTISDDEINRKHFGKMTRAAVEKFQKKQGIEVSGVVEEETARRINAEVDARELKQFTVSGDVRYATGAPLPKVIVKAYDRDLRKESMLGLAVLDTQGNYLITYNSDQFRKAEKDTADLIVRAFDKNGNLLAESDTHFNVADNVKISLTVHTREEPKLTEYEKLVMDLTPLLEGQGTSFAGLTKEDITFLYKDTENEITHIGFLAESARLSQRTNIPTEFFYGLARRDLKLNLEFLLDQSTTELKEALKSAIDGKIVPNSLLDVLDKLLSQFKQLRFDMEMDKAYTFFGRLVNEDTKLPLAGFTVRAFDPEAENEPVQPGHDISNARGLFAIHFMTTAVELPEDGEELPEYKLLLDVLNIDGVIISQREVTFLLGSDEITDIAFIPPAAPDTTSKVTDLAGALHLGLSSDLLDLLKKNDINTLADINARGGISGMEGLPVTSDVLEVVATLDNHANLSVLSADLTLNQRLIDNGLTNVGAVADVSRASFVSTFGEHSGTVAAARLHAGAVATNLFLNNLTTGLAANIANNFDFPLVDETEAADHFTIRCKCNDCESAVSPISYLADLLDYAHKHLWVTGATGSTVLATIEMFAESLHQPFGELPASCGIIQRELLQVRICIEVLRSFLGTQPLDAERANILSHAEGLYRLAAYEALLASTGTSLDALRMVRTADVETQEQLARRLGIAVARLNDLLLEPDNITEQTLERIFGLMDTTRDVLSEGAKWGDDGSNEQVMRWRFEGVMWGRNTDIEGRLYLSLSRPQNHRFQVDVFSDSGRSQLVATGHRDTVRGTVVLEAVGGSGLTGAVNIQYEVPYGINSIETSVVPDLLSWQLDFLRERWRERDWPASSVPGMLPLIDPDVIGPGDFVNIASDDPAFSLWLTRQEEVKGIFGTIKSARGAVDLSSALNMVMSDEAPSALEHLRSLRVDLRSGTDIKESLTTLGLELSSFTRLLEIVDLSDSLAMGETLLVSELKEFDDILTQVQKSKQFEVWRTAESDAGIVLSPDFFRIATEEPEELTPWRATRAHRRDWQERLELRIEQEQTAIDKLRKSVESAEEATLTALRDALILASNAKGNNLNDKAEWITQNLFIDAKMGACHRTTRIAQAIETIQGLLWGVRTGATPETFTEIELDADYFTEEWQWLGTYETWRAALLVFLYPENVLFPSLRKEKTSGFRGLIKYVRTQNRLTPQQACSAAQEYARYVRDVCSMEVEAACMARTLIHIGEECKDKTATMHKTLRYFFGRGQETTSVYWSSHDPGDKLHDTQTYWEAVPNLTHVNTIIGAVPYQVHDEERYICLFVRTFEEGAQHLKLARYDLDKQKWLGEIIPLDLPTPGGNRTTRFTGVARQRTSDKKAPHLAIRVRNGAIYDRRLNKDADGWRDDDSENDINKDGDWHIIVPSSKGREFRKIVAMVEYNDNQFFLVVQDGGLHIKYRLFGERDDGDWHPNYRNIHERGSVDFWKGTPIGSLHLNNDRLYQFWQKEKITGVLYNYLEEPGEEISTKIVGYQYTSPGVSIYSKEFKNFTEFDEWLRDITGLSLRDIPVIAPKSGFEEVANLFDYLTIDIEEVMDSEGISGYEDEKEFEEEYIDHVEGLLTLLEDNIRKSTGWEWKDWKYADALVDYLSLHGGSLADFLRALHEEFYKNTGNFLFKIKARTDEFSEYFLANSSGIVQIIAPVGPDVSGDPVLATRFENRQVGSYRSTYHVEGNGSLTEMDRIRLAPRCPVSIDIPGRLSDDASAIRRQLIADAFKENQDGPASLLTYFQEAYYFVPVYLALQLQRRGQYLAAIDWFRTVYDYTLPKGKRKIYDGLIREENLGAVYERATNWLLDPLNPHSIAETRANTYTRYTVLSIAKCLLEFGDAEFTRDTAESISRARSLYSAALKMLNTELRSDRLDRCLSHIDGLKRDVGRIDATEATEWTPVLNDMFRRLGRISEAEALSTVVDDVRRELGRSTVTLSNRLINMEKIVREAVGKRSHPLDLKAAIDRKSSRSKRIHKVLLSNKNIYTHSKKVSDSGISDFDLAFASVTGRNVSESGTDGDGWLRQPLSHGLVNSTTLATGSISANSSVTGEVNPVSPPGFAVIADAVGNEPHRALKLLKKSSVTFLPIITADFCVPLNPVFSMLSLHAELNLLKIRTCRNITGDKRQLEPYSANLDIESALPAIGAGGQIRLPGSIVLRPTPFRYSTLIERAKQLVGLAQQIESSFLAALEKRDAEFYNLIRARQETRLSQAGVRLQDLRVREAEGGLKLAELQRERSEIQVDHYNDLLTEGMTSLEEAAAGLLITAATAHSLAVVSDSFWGNISWGILANPAKSIAQAASATASVLQFYASQERREQEWKLQLYLARHDIRIGNQHIKISKDHIRVVGQERTIAEMQAEHAEATAEFLATKFTNAELYEWMSQVLEGVYSFFLQEASSTARLAENQLAFERQDAPPPFIQHDYWEAPLGMETLGSGDGKGPDRRGLTGGTRLLQDIYQLDQYAFDTDERKLQLTKTISLASMAPAEFQRFRETGVIPFSTVLKMFDQDFPGHYLRLIKQVRTTVIALIPPIDGIKATLSTTGISRVVIQGEGAFTTVETIRPPKSIALSSPTNATGLFELTPQQHEKLLPFEGMGVDASWELQLPKAANLFDFNTIADVLVTIDYTALNSFDYRKQVIDELDRSISAERPFSFRHELADQWYHLHNPEQTENPMTVTFNTRKEDFPPNLEDLTIRHIVLYFAFKDGSSFGQNVDVNLIFASDDGNTEQGVAIPIDGIISTRSVSGIAWSNMIGISPFGEWSLALPDEDAVKDLFKDDKIENILFVITYEGRTPEWPM